MARYCSAQESARTRWSPSYRETIFVNVVQGTKSMSCANRVLPVYMAVSAEKSARLCPQPIQVDTAHFWPETRAIPGFQSFVPSVNRTAVMKYPTCVPFALGKMYYIAVLRMGAVRMCGRDIPRFKV